MSRRPARPQRRRPRRGRRLLLEALRDRAGQAPPGLRQLRRRRAAAEARAHREPGARRAASTTSASRSSSTAEVPPPHGPPERRGPRNRHRGRGHVLLRRAGQGVGRRPRRRAVGDLHRARRQRHARGRLRAARVDEADSELRCRGDATPRPHQKCVAPVDVDGGNPSSGRAHQTLVAAVWCGGARHRVARRRDRRVGNRRLVVCRPIEVGLQLLENTFATAAALAAIILVIGPVSGAHLNPAVTLVDCSFGRCTTAEAAGYIGRGSMGPAWARSSPTPCSTCRSSRRRRRFVPEVGIWLGEVVVTLGLILVIFGLTDSRRTSLRSLRGRRVRRGRCIGLRPPPVS